MTDVKKDIEFAKTLIEGKQYIESPDDYLRRFCKIWPFADIKMEEYLKHFDLKDKVCATIQGSSDHIFELHLKGAKKIIGIDTNPLTQYPFYLKQAAFKVLETKEDFIKFFSYFDTIGPCANNPNSFDRDIYLEIEKYLTDRGKIFWHELFNNYDPLKIRKNLFQLFDEPKPYVLVKIVKYLEQESYEYLRKNAENINFEFLNVDIRNLNDSLNEKVDFITLSNLILHAKSMFGENHLEKYRDMVESLGAILNNDGTIVAGYIYGIDEEEPSYVCDICNKKIRDKVFSDSSFSYEYFDSYIKLYQRNDKTHDACLIYKPSNSNN